MLLWLWDELGRFILIYVGIHLAALVLRHVILKWVNRDRRR
jgi:hypothetical protein